MDYPGEDQVERATKRTVVVDCGFAVASARSACVLAGPVHCLRLAFSTTGRGRAWSISSDRLRLQVLWR